MVRQSQLLAGRLGMDVDDDRLHGAAQRMAGELGVQGAERVVGQRHEQAAEHLQDERRAGRAAVRISATPRPGVPGARLSGRTIRGSRSMWPISSRWSQTWLPMVEHVGTGVEELGGDRGRQPVAAGGVLGVDDDRVQRERRPQLGQLGQEHGTAGAADHVADEQDPHGLSFPSRRRTGSRPR